MQFIKKHYDKIILSAVLLLLAVVAVMLPFAVSAFKTELATSRIQTATTPPAPFEHTDLSTNKALIARSAAPKAPVLSGEHNLLNPRTWTRRADGTLVKSEFGAEQGIDAIRVVKIDALKLSVEFVNPDLSLATPTYKFKLINPETRTTNTYTLQQGQQASRVIPIAIKSVVGPANNPTAFALTLRMANRPEETIDEVGPNKAFERVVGYVAEFYNTSNQQRIPAKKKGDNLPNLPGDSETYTIINIEAASALIEAKSSGVRKDIPLTPTTGAPRSGQ